MTAITDRKPLQYFFLNIHLYSPINTHILIVFNFNVLLLYSKSKTDEYKASIVPGPGQGKLTRTRSFTLISYNIYIV
jgi:hypothetical protein